MIDNLTLQIFTCFGPRWTWDDFTAKHSNVGKRLCQLTKYPMKKIQSLASELADYVPNKVRRDNSVEAARKEEIKVTKTEVEKKPTITDVAPPKLTSLVYCKDPIRDRICEILAEALCKVSGEADDESRDEVNALQSVSSQKARNEELKVAWDLYNDLNSKCKKVEAQKQAKSEIQRDVLESGITNVNVHQIDHKEKHLVIVLVSFCGYDIIVSSKSSGVFSCLLQKYRTNVQ
ncbi:hypothetical protein Tco_1062594 [Tanacetum coccineum]